jgi:hypothetical protein
MAIVRAGDHIVSSPAGVDLGSDRARVDQTNALDTAALDGPVQFVGDRRDGEHVIRIGHRSSFHELAPAARKVDASDEDRA